MKLLVKIGWLWVSAVFWYKAVCQDSIVFNGGQVLYGVSEVKEPWFGEQKIRFKDSTEFMASHVRSVSNEDGYYMNINGRLAMRTLHGPRIDQFSDYVTSYSGGRNGMISASTSYTPLYFTKDGGQPQSLTIDNIRMALKDHEPSIKLLDRRKALTVSQIVMLVGGLGIIATAFQGVDKENPPNKERLIAGGIVANLLWIPQIMKNDLQDKAIELYNRQGAK